MTLLRPPALAEGAGQSAGVSGRILDRSHYVSVPIIDPGVTAGPVQLPYATPPGYLALFNLVSFVAAAGGYSVPWFIMADRTTAPATADRVTWWFPAIGSSAATEYFILDEGWSLWAWWTTSTPAAFTAILSALLIPKPVAGGLWTPQLVKSVPVVDTVWYQVTTPGNWAVPMTSSVRVCNTTAAAITLTLKRSTPTDPVPRVIFQLSCAANSSATVVNQVCVVNAGEALLYSASAPGLNLYTVFNEKGAAV